MKNIKLLTTAILFALLTSVSADLLKEKDADKDGKLSVKEFAGEDKKMKKKFKKLDTDKDGFLNAEELKKGDSGEDMKKKKKDKKK